MVGRDAAKRELVKAATEAGLRGCALAWFVGWGESWLARWTREVRFSIKMVTVMASSAAGFAARRFREAA